MEKGECRIELCRPGIGGALPGGFPELFHVAQGR